MYGELIILTVYFGQMVDCLGLKNVGADNDYSDCELAMSTFNNKVTYVKVDWSGFIMPANERGQKEYTQPKNPYNFTNGF